MVKIKLLSMTELKNVKFKKVHGLHTIFDFSTEYKIDLFLTTNNGFYTSELFNETFVYKPEDVVYILCDSTDEELLKEQRFSSGMTYILVQNMLLDTNSCRNITIEDLKKMFGEGTASYYYDYVVYNEPDFITGIGVWDKNI